MCLREGRHHPWCPDAPNDVTLVDMPQLPVERRCRHGGTPRWAIASIAAGVALMAVSVVGLMYRSWVALWILMVVHG